MTSPELLLLIDRCRRHDRRAQEQLFRHFYNYALTVASRYAGGGPEAREILQDAFLKVFSQLHRYGGEGDFRWWLRRIVINTAIDYWRSRIARPTPDSLDQAALLSVEPEGLDDLQAADLLELVQQLPPAYRIVFSLHVVEGFSHEEIAIRLGISAGTSKSNLFKAKAHLQRLIKKQETG